jgi:ABC-type sugar transport system ATPase subunit
MVYVTHDQVEAMTLGDRIVVMKDGLIQQVDTPMALYGRPANRFVAGFIGSPAMNFFISASAPKISTTASFTTTPSRRAPASTRSSTSSSPWGRKFTFM